MILNSSSVLLLFLSTLILTFTKKLKTMNYLLELTPEQTQIVVKGLNELKHGESRATVDTVMNQIQAQNAEAQRKQREAQETQEEPKPEKK